MPVALQHLRPNRPNMNTIAFHAARHFAQKRTPRKPAPSREFRFADEISRREFERELRGEPLQFEVANPLCIISGNDPEECKRLVNHILAATGNHPGQWPFPPRVEREMRLTIEDAIRNCRSPLCLDLSGWKQLGSHSICHYATVKSVSLRPHLSQVHAELPVNLRFYIIAQSGIAISHDLQRRSRSIVLA